MSFRVELRSDMDSPWTASAGPFDSLEVAAQEARVIARSHEGPLRVVDERGAPRFERNRRELDYYKHAGENLPWFREWDRMYDSEGRLALGGRFVGSGEEIDWATSRKK